MKRSLTLTALAIFPCFVLCGCTSKPSAPGIESPETNMAALEEKIDTKVAALEEKIDTKMAALEKKIDDLPKWNKEHGSTPGDEVRKSLDTVISKLDELLTRIPAVGLGIDTSKFPQGSTTDLELFLITNDPKEKREIALHRVRGSEKHKEVTPESIDALVNDLEALNVILNVPELLDPQVLQQVESARNRLVQLLRDQIPTVVRTLDEQAVQSTDYTTAKRLWAQSSAVLGFYPSSNDPIEAGKIQQLVSDHESVRARIEVCQQQRYNLWACQQIRKAWKDFEANADAQARMQTCLHFLGPIHPALLDPVPLDLYRDFVQAVRNKLSQELYQDLAEKLAEAQRKLLADIEDTK
ncbi:MAG: hypothetical protein KatS3mg109_0303 [Pirellulaceae bacterium]|nr:MAG: hypothetical protein KatS3mg109_0303 [Pirellulaceae bacterium]